MRFFDVCLLRENIIGGSNIQKKGFWQDWKKIISNFVLLSMDSYYLDHFYYEVNNRPRSDYKLKVWLYGDRSSPVNLLHIFETPFLKNISGSLLLYSEAALHGCSPVNLLHIFRTPFPKNTQNGCFCLFVILHISSIKAGDYYFWIQPS